MRALGASPWVCLSVRALVHSQGKDIASGVLLVANSRAPYPGRNCAVRVFTNYAKKGFLLASFPKHPLILALRLG